MTALVPILPRYARALWPQIAEWIASATDEASGWWQPDDVLAGVERDELTLWIVADADRLYGVVVTEVETAVRHSIGVIALCAGVEQSKWLHLLPELESWAAERGCTEMMVKGRAGWVRRLRAHGYGERYIAVGKGLS